MQNSNIDLKKLFENPLIIGASISADYSTASPSKRLARRFTDEAKIRTYAMPGSPGLQVLSRIPPSMLENTSVVIGFDLMFWDSTRDVDGKRSQKILEEFIEKLASKNIPFVIGDIPELLPGRQPCRRDLNELIHKKRSEKPLYRVVDLDALYRGILRDGFLKVKGKPLTLRQLVPDGLHVNEAAAEELADRMLERIVEIR